MQKRYPPLSRETNVGKLYRQLFVQKTPDNSPDYWVIRDEQLISFDGAVHQETLDSSPAMRFPSYRKAAEEANRNHASNLANGFKPTRVMRPGAEMRD